jgi:bacteriocin-like protein
MNQLTTLTEEELTAIEGGVFEELARAFWDFVHTCILSF